MQNSEIFDKLSLVFKDIFNVEIQPEYEAKDVDGWDSLKHIELVNAIESAFGVKFKMKDVLSMTSVKSIIACLSQKL